MEKRFLALVLSLSLHLAVGTPANASTEPFTAATNRSTHAGELSDVGRNKASSSSYSSESLSPSQRNTLLWPAAEAHTAAAAAAGGGSADSKHTEAFTETTGLSTGPLASTRVMATAEASSSGSSSGSSRNWRDSFSTRQTSHSSPAVSWEASSWRSSEKATLPQESPDTTLPEEDSSSSSSFSLSSSSFSTFSSSSSSSSFSLSSPSSSSSSSASSSSSSSSSSSFPSSSSSSSSSSTSSSSLSSSSSPSTSSSSSSSPSSSSHSAVDPNSTFAFTTISRAGERTLLSVTSSAGNSTSSSFTEDSNSHQPGSNWDVSSMATETADYTGRSHAGETTDQHTTRPFSSSSPETGSSLSFGGTQSLTEEPNSTQHLHLSTSLDTLSDSTLSDSTLSLGTMQPSTDLPLQTSVSSAPPIISPTGGSSAGVSGTPQQRSSSGVETSTEASTGVHRFSTQNQQGTEVVSYRSSEQSTGLAETTGPPLVNSTSAELDSSRTLTAAAEVTEATTTTTTNTPVTVTHRLYVTEEDTVRASTAASTTAPTTTTLATPPPAATTPWLLSSVGSTAAAHSPTEATSAAPTPALQTTLPSTASGWAPRSSVATVPPTTPSSRLQLSTAGTAATTDPTTLQTSAGAMEVTTVPKPHTTSPFTPSSPGRSTQAGPTTAKQRDRGTTEPAGAGVTTSATATWSTEALAPPLRNPCAPNPCMNGGMCDSSRGRPFSCRCPQSWTGPTCSQDVDECRSSPCPVGSRCVNTHGSFSCECPLGFDLEDGRTCTRAKTFLGAFSVNGRDPLVVTHEIQRQLIHLLNASLSALRGYSRSTLTKKEKDGVHISAVNMFSISADVTSAEVYNSIQMFLSNCSSSSAHCHVVLQHKMTYHMESLCAAQKTQCNPERSTCSESSGSARCQCFQGYYKHNQDDQSCLECGDGYKLENGTCVPCMFGFGGFNCGNFYKLIAVVVSPAGGALLLILIIALIVTCRKKDKNDINKIIFKSGDMQMSPYADFPKSNRISMEWGRETIEMQENGSTKNLLQMTDIYYSPALRNSDLDRNGLYPFTGLPGSRHSCIYPAQWNPSFISDDSRRRDYF